MAIKAKALSGRTRTRLGIFGLILLLGGVLTLVDQRGEGPAPGPLPAGEGGEPDYYLEGAHYTRFDDRGRPAQTMQSPRITHTPGDDVTRAQTPSFTLLADDGTRWLASGESATLRPGGDRFTLSGNADLRQPERDFQLQSDVLHYDLNDRHAYSDSESLFTQNLQRTRGDRFDAWLNEDRLRLEGGVRGHHPPVQ